MARVRPLLLLLLLPAACTTPERGGRGVDANGPLLSGASIGQVQLAVVSLGEGVTLGERTLSDVALAGTELKGGGADAFALSGALLYGRTTDGRAVRLRVDAVSQAEDPRPATPQNELEGVLLYTLSYQTGTVSGDGAERRFTADGDSRPLCLDNKGALALGGRWDHGKGQPRSGRRLSQGDRDVTFACPDGALFKCVRLGYRPWQGPALARLHEACVRAVRADYCGIGASLTEAGTRVDYYDPQGVQKDTRDWSFEAVWTEGGARCVAGTRRGKEAAAYVQRTCPDRWRPGACGPDKGDGEGVLYTEYDPHPDPNAAAKDDGL